MANREHDVVESVSEILAPLKFIHQIERISYRFHRVAADERKSDTPDGGMCLYVGV